MAVFRKSYDALTLFSLVMISFIGVLLIYSSDYTSNGSLIKIEYIKQIVWVFSGFFIIFFIGRYDLKIVHGMIYPLYFLLIASLIFTVLFGVTVNGARSWIGIWKLGGQPSEFGKIISILALAKFYSSREEGHRSFFVFIFGFILILPVVLFVLLQPDFGTAVVYLNMFIFISFFAGIDIHYILYFTLTGIFSFLFMVLPVWYEYKADMGSILYLIFSNNFYFKVAFLVLVLVFLFSAIGFFISKYNLTIKFVYFYMLFMSSILLISAFFSKFISKFMKPYQVKRFLVFLDPNIDLKGAGWNLNQVKVAIGSGGIFGKGFLKGPYTHAKYVPSQSTDFIFSILAEEFGFFGASVVLVLFFFIFFRILIIMNKSKDVYMSLVLAGVLSLLFFHTSFNIGMSLGLLPITGIPLPFLSYGGSSTITFFLAMTLYFNIESIVTMD
ncbi:rod shape-determining protein RodA [Borrelia miyamotoi]|uniref:Cell wall polymerase n=1 Tax=Borrelia miyamotoi TaxID=47466 RepID=A0AAP8YTJ2_9SPIR|nr:rod shape-determining protein RodA [Borrelia miyamotoi]ATQ14541.1 rod shape-determining protein RodA [Borrelia miyamotoi]ATQ15725.1 rod shape-determining protein RodA [Borrelia miyamotoi]ATQ16870.1 rod shape-determining protein RodA [Borrelia miyamotoi]ATQ18625.1 rod shape-determining protein RodA [Borrelia miyamotoi]ATQ19367.1 rod shape-determining protein RodA [Borrelia miyamotoi]